MAEPEDLLLGILREMRAENEVRHREYLTRFDQLEATQVSFRHAMTADTLLGKLVTGEFEERIELLEPKLEQLGRLEGKVRDLESAK